MNTRKPKQKVDPYCLMCENPQRAKENRQRIAQSHDPEGFWKEVAGYSHTSDMEKKRMPYWMRKESLPAQSSVKILPFVSPFREKIDKGSADEVQ